VIGGERESGKSKFIYTIDPITRWADFFIFLLLAYNLKAEGKI